MLDWLARFPDEVLDADARLLLVQAWVVGAARARGTTCARAVARVRALGGLDDGPAARRLRLARRRACRVLSAAFGWGDVRAILDARRARRRSSRARTRRGGRWSRWALGWAHYCNGDLDAGRALADGDDRSSRPPAEQWIVGVARDRRPVADRRPARRPRASSCGSRTRRSTWRASAGCSTRVEVGEVHTAYGVALAAHGRREEALPELEQGVFLRRLWGQPLDLSTA